MEIKNSLKTILKRLKLSGILATLPERIAYAQKAKLPSEDLLELILQDEVDRRDQVNLQRRLKRASFTRFELRGSLWSELAEKPQQRLGLALLSRPDDPAAEMVYYHC